MNLRNDLTTVIPDNAITFVLGQIERYGLYDEFDLSTEIGPRLTIEEVLGALLLAGEIEDENSDYYFQLEELKQENEKLERQLNYALSLSDEFESTGARAIKEAEELKEENEYLESEREYLEDLLEEIKEKIERR